MKRTKSYHFEAPGDSTIFVGVVHVLSDNLNCY